MLMMICYGGIHLLSSVVCDDYSAPRVGVIAELNLLRT